MTKDAHEVSVQKSSDGDVTHNDLQFSATDEWSMKGQTLQSPIQPTVSGGRGCDLAHQTIDPNTKAFNQSVGIHLLMSVQSMLMQLL